MATKKILIQVILDDKAGKKIDDTSGKVKKLSSAVTILNKEQREQIINDEKSAIHKRALITQLKLEAAAQMNAAAATKKGRAQSGLNNAILLESGRLASDLNYGFTAIANNLGQLVTLFGSFAETNGGVVASLKALGRSLWGMGGVLIGVQLLIAFGPDILKFMKDITGFGNKLKDAFDDINESIGNTTGKFELYIRTLEDSTKSDKEHSDAVKQLNKEFPEYIKNLKDAGLTIDDVKNKTDGAAKVNDIQRKTIMKLAMARAAQSKIEDEAAKLLQLNIDEEIEKRDLLNKRKSEIERNNQRLAENELLRQKVLDGTATYFERNRFSNAERNDTKFTKNHKRKLKRIDEDIAAVENSNKKERDQIEETIDLLLDFTDIQVEQDKKKGDSRKEYTELSVDNFDEEIKAIKELGRVRKKFFDRNLAQDVKDKQFEEDKIKLLRKQELTKVDLMEGSEVAKNQARLEINTYYDKLKTEAETKTQEKLESIKEKFAVKSLQKQVNIAEDDLFKEKDVVELEEKQSALLSKQKELDIARLDELKLTVTERKEAEKVITDYYDNLATENAEKNAKAREKITEIEKKSKLQALDDIGKGLMAASQIAGKATGAGKGLAVAGTLVSTYSAAQKAYESQMVPSIDSPVRAAIAAASAIAQGLANVKAIMSVKTPAMKGVGSVSGGGSTTVQAPDFNVVGQSATSQLVGAVQGQFGGALRAYVVSSDISSAQELDRKINTTSVIG